jgi:uncharacterized membrane protein YebE (DUF533 family)
MEDYQEAIVKSLVAVAWADGRVDQGESEVIDAIVSAFGLSEDDAAEVKSYAREPRSLDDVPLTDLSAHDRRMLLQHAVILTFADGEQSDAEKKIIDDLVQRLRLEDSEAKELLATSEARARRHLDLL